jgi:catechol 2,3-dioxygenase-like lactoylglutathione lyase family enzyme
MQPLGIHHVAINVSDVPGSVAFYTGVLGGTLRSDRPELGVAGAWIDLGSEQVHLLEAPVPRNLGQHVAIRFADLDAVVAELRSEGIEVADPSPSGRGRQTFINDPSGNAIELHQAGTTAT